MAKSLKTTIREYVSNEHIAKRYIRPDEADKMFKYKDYNILDLAFAAGAVYQLPKIILIKQKKLEDYMRHLYKVPGTGKYVQKKYVRVGEGSIMYSIGRHRFIEMARNAGAVYKITGMVLINLDIFDEYMEQFREQAT